jgi:hypothetical protein
MFIENPVYSHPFVLLYCRFILSFIKISLCNTFYKCEYIDGYNNKKLFF